MTWQVHLRITQYSNAGLRSWQQAKEDESIPSLWTPAARREYWNNAQHIPVHRVIIAMLLTLYILTEKAEKSNMFKKNKNPL